MRSKKAKDMSPTEVKSTSDIAKSEAQDPELLLKTLIAKGKKKGYLTYEEINESLPDDAVSAKRLEKLMSTLDEMGVALVDEGDTDAHGIGKVDEDFEEEAEPVDEDEEAEPEVGGEEDEGLDHREAQDHDRLRTRDSRKSSPRARFPIGSMTPFACI